MTYPRALVSLTLLCCTGAHLMASDGTLAIATGPAQLGTAGAGSADPQDATWMNLNPAGIAQVRGQLDLGAEVATAHTTLAPAGPASNPGAGSMSATTTETLPYVMTCMPGMGGSIGLGVSTIGGLAIDYPRSRSVFGAFGGGYDRSAELAYHRATLAYASTCHDWTFGIALDADLARFRTDSATATTKQTAGRSERDHAYGAGFQVGASHRWGPLAVDLAYTSRQWLQRFHDYADYTTSLDIPQMVQVGAAVRVLPWLEPVLDYRFINWRGVAAYGNAAGGLGWRNQNVVALGLNATLSERWQARAGVSYGNSPIGSGAVFVNGLSPLIATTHAAVGLGWSATHLRADLSVMQTFKHRLTDSGADASGAGRGTSESFELTSVALGFGYMY